MEKKSFSAVSRRDFIRQAACAAVGTAAMTAAIRDLRFMNAAVAQSNINDYKALVCIFLAGGNDSNNLIIPSDANDYNAYAAARQGLAIPQTSLLPIAAATYSDGRTFGLHPSLIDPPGATGQPNSRCALKSAPGRCSSIKPASPMTCRFWPPSEMAPSAVMPRLMSADSWVGRHVEPDGPASRR